MSRLLLSLLLLLPLGTAAQDVLPKVHFETTAGAFTVELFNDTPLHRDNFLRLVREGYYDGTTFHRVISNFMVQGGDPQTRDSETDPALIGEGGPDYTLPAEIFAPADSFGLLRPLHHHVRGALAMAREGDDVNPDRRSAGSQFYVVWGTTWQPKRLERVWERVEQMVGARVSLPDDVRQAYYFTGGTPHLDGQYTVFGRLTEGLTTIEDIQAAGTDLDTNRPLTDIRIVSATVVE